MGKLFRVLRRIATPFLPKLTACWAEPMGEDEGPCVFIGNHMGAMGPIYMVTRFPLADQAEVWCDVGVMEEARIVAYIRQDYWWKPESFFAPLWNVTLPYIAKAIVPKVMRSAPTIPVYRDNRIMTTMRRSMKTLKEGKHLVIFPEKPDGFDSHAEELQMGWLNICELYRKQTGRDLPIRPVYIAPQKHTFYIGKSIVLDAEVPLKEQEKGVERYLAAGLRGENLPQASF